MRNLIQKKSLLLGLSVMVVGPVWADSYNSESKNTSPEIDRNDADLINSDDQSAGSSTDVEITRSIRKDLVNRNDLSTDAKNVKIVTLGGKVTLRGQVDSESEKKTVESVARQHVRGQKISNEIEVKSNR